MKLTINQKPESGEFDIKATPPLFQAIYNHVVGIQEFLSTDEEHSLEEICGPEFWSSLDYGEPSLAKTVAELSKYDEIVLLPLYPQFSATTTGSVYDQVADIFRASRDIPSIQVIREYYQHPLYIEALAMSVEAYWQQHEKGECLLMSFHGIPQSNVDLGDPYYQ